MPDLVVRIKKKNDGSAALSCTRADGSVTWQRQEGAQGRFFPLHDLTHLAVETTLGFRRAFYGLLAEGWDISQFAEPGIAKRIPAEALLVEVLVSFFDVERATGERASVDDFNWKIDSYYAERGLPRPGFRMTDDGLATIRRRIDELFERWSAVRAGDALEIGFERADTKAAVNT
ncbi:MAG TPA: hypothetical protein VH277_01105 [Gemmatimonadaceae bacterium]|jgi:hypothetical protein|nr:hypothetical protein [Gemmatimonadaceae bacterium]